MNSGLHKIPGTPPAQDAVVQDDLALARAAAMGDKSAFEKLYRKHLDRVYGFSLRLTADEGQAEILTQDTFVKAWFAMSGYAGRGDLGGWLTRIAINVWRDQYRSKARANRLHQELQREVHSDAAGPVDRSSSGHDSIVALLTGLDLERCIARLPLGARTVFVLHQVEGYPQDEIATMLNVATGTVKAQVHRAKQLLRAMLGQKKEIANGR